MTIHHVVRVGQIWRSNDPRRLRAVRIERIVGYESGKDLATSILTPTINVAKNDRVRVCDLVTGKHTTIRREHFCTGVRGYSLEKDIVRADAAQ